MNQRERILSAVRGEKTDLPAVAPYMGNFSIRFSGMSLSDCYCNAESMARAQLISWEEFGQDAIVVQSDNYYMAEAFGAPVDHESDAMPVLRDSLIKQPEDVFALHPVNPRADGRMPVYIEAIARVREAVGTDVAIRGCGTGPFVLAGHLCGIERLMLWLAETEAEVADHTEALERLFYLGLETLIGFATAQLEAGATIIQLADSLASLNAISPAMYRKYVFPYEQRFFSHMSEVCSTHDGVSLLHICGDNTEVFGDYADTGADIIAIDHGARLSDAVERIGDRACMIGNIDPAGVLLFGSTEEVAASVRECLDTAFPGRYILGTGCEVSPDTPPDNIHAMIGTGREYAGRGAS